MPIVPSRAQRVQTLVGQLASERTAARDSAVAQLTLLGPRVVEPLLASLPDAPVRARLAALEVLERLDDRRALPALLSLATDPSPRVAVRAIELVGRTSDSRSVTALAEILAGAAPPRRQAAAEALARLHGAGLVEALAPLVDTLVDDEAETGLRLVILDALLRLEPRLLRSTLKPLGRRLASSRDPAVAARAAGLDQPHPRRGGSKDVVDRLREGEIGEDEAPTVAALLKTSRDVPLERLHEALGSTEAPRVVRALAAVLGRVGGPSSIPALSRALTRLAEAPGSDEDREGALEARAALHSALAALDSGIALHDLRELLARHPSSVMPQLLDAATQVVNASFVPALARAAGEDPALLEPCASTYAVIARRGRLRRSSAALRRVRAEHRPALEAFLATPARRRR
jgi:HEAT repeat protein